MDVFMDVEQDAYKPLNIYRQKVPTLGGYLWIPIESLSFASPLLMLKVNKNKKRDYLN